MYAHRTFITRLGYAGLVGCCLVGAPALAAVNSNGIELLSSSSTGVKSGQYIEAAASVRYQHVNTSQRIYTKALVPVATSTLRRGALAAMSRGVMHPGFQLAIMAAGLVLSSDQSEILVASEPDISSDVPFNGATELQSTLTSNCLGYRASKSGMTIMEVYNYCDAAVKASSWTWEALVEVSISSSSVAFIYSDARGGIRGQYTASSDGVSTYDGLAEADAVANSEPVLSPASDSDIEAVDQYIPPQLYDELWNDGPIPVWQDEITVLGAPASYVQPTGDQAVAPEVATKAGQWAENVAAQLDGETIPNPDTDADGMTAEEAAYEDAQQQENEPPPPFPDPEVDWQTETLTLPDYNSGIGGGVCPPPASIPMPLGDGTIDWSYQPACDLAEMARPAFLGACGLIALLIVLRARGGTS